MHADSQSSACHLSRLILYWNPASSSGSSCIGKDLFLQPLRTGCRIGTGCVLPISSLDFRLHVFLVTYDSPYRMDAGYMQPRIGNAANLSCISYCALPAYLLPLGSKPHSRGRVYY